MVQLAADLTAHGIPTFGGTTVEALLDEVGQGAQAGDVVLVMSNGGFGDFIARLLERLAARPGGR